MVNTKLLVVASTMACPAFLHWNIGAGRPTASADSRAVLPTATDKGVGGTSNAGANDKARLASTCAISNIAIPEPPFFPATWAVYVPEASERSRAESVLLGVKGI